MIDFNVCTRPFRPQGPRIGALQLHSKTVVHYYGHGGTVHHRLFENQREFAGVSEHTIVHCTGYGARALMKDDSIVPVRGQTARLIPQPEVDYALIYRGHNLVMVPRHDGILVQAQDVHDHGNADTTINHAQSEAAVLRLAELFQRA